MNNLSPAAQAVWDAFNDVSERVGVFEDYGDALAAALRAAADQWKNEIRKQPCTEFISGIKNCIDALNELADELEGQ